MFFVLTIGLMLAGCREGGPQAIKVDGEYQAVFLDNGQIFFGKLSDTGSEYLMLKDVYYIENKVNPQTKVQAGVLVKRGNEWHGPDHMRINSRHIVAIEPVASDSKIAQLIREDAKVKK
ncbi:MAG: hypothetical protein AABY45_09570 [Deltaproteobacteria bacterium]